MAHPRLIPYNSMMPATDGEWTIRRLLEWTSGFFERKSVDNPRLSAELLLSHVLDKPRIALYTNYQRVLSEDQLKRFRELVRRGAEQEPIAYLTGRAPFFNLEFDVTPDVLIPRPDTETLVENVLQLNRAAPQLQATRILDLCTGSGCIAAALARHLKQAFVVAIDISPKAVAVATKNIERLGLASRVTVRQGDLFAPLAAEAREKGLEPFDLLVSNPPYIPSEEIASLDASVRDFEPRVALDGGPDGLTIHRKILAQAAEYLKTDAYLLLEIAYNQGPAALALAAEFSAYHGARLLKDFGGHDRVLLLRRGSSA